MTDPLQVTLENQIKKRINYDSPSKYDLDFYSRKISRLQNDNTQLNQELSKARIRLRRAEDFELKYELILKQVCSLQSDLDSKEKSLADAKSKIQQFQQNLKQKQTKHEDWQVKISQLQSEVDKWKTKAEESQQNRLQTIMDLKQKKMIEIKRQTQLIRKQFSQKQEQHLFQIRQLKKSLHQKQAIQTVVNGRVQKIRSEKDEQINRLRENMAKIKQQFKETVQDKNQEIEQLRQKFQKIFNFELQNLKKNADDQDQLFNIQMNGLRQLIGIKNDQINRLIRQLKEQSQYDRKQRQQLNSEINYLKESIYKIQRQNELQIISIKERTSKIHSVQIQSIQKRFSEIIQSLKVDKKSMQILVQQKDKIIQDEHKELERIKADYIDRLKERQARIQQLQQRLKQNAQMNQNQMKSLHQSFHKIQSQKQMLSSDYQENVGFLNNQIAKQSASNQSKNQTIKKLHEEISRVKKQYNSVIVDIQNRWKEERKQWELSKQQDRKKYQDLLELGLQKQRQWKAKEKQFIRQRQRVQRQNDKLRFIIKQMESDTQRLNQYIKQLDDALKRQYKKNQMATLDNGGIRRELTAELQRQKSQLQAITRMEVDQAKKKMDVNLTKLTNQNQKLQTELLKKQQALEATQQQLKKVQNLNKNIQKINKQKLIQYEKKMATLNNQINLTQNLYNSFLDSKSKKK